MPTIEPTIEPEGINHTYGPYFGTYTYLIKHMKKREEAWDMRRRLNLAR